MRPLWLLAAALASARCSTDLPRELQDLGPLDAAPDRTAQEDVADSSVDLPTADATPDGPGGEPAAQDAGPDVAGESPVDAPPPDGVTCPNGTCEMAMGEDDANCPQDCGCTAVASCADTAPFGCECDVCSVWLSTNCVDAEAICGVPIDPCGNGVCDYCETAATCPQDGCL